MRQVPVFIPSKIIEETGISEMRNERVAMLVLERLAEVHGQAGL